MAPRSGDLFKLFPDLPRFTRPSLAERLAAIREKAHRTRVRAEANAVRQKAAAAAVRDRIARRRAR
ncbi:MAG TPA: hypothetical protein VGJ29_14405 [Vicinamibacterales bacterium]|jgi:hypothetical protein